MSTECIRKQRSGILSGSMSSLKQLKMKMDNLMHFEKDEQQKLNRGSNRKTSGETKSSFYSQVL